MLIDRDKLKFAATVSLLFLAVAIPVVVLALQITYHMTATVQLDETATAYEDSLCTIPLTTPYDWGSVTDGSVVSVWIKNEGNVPLDITVTIIAETDCTITPSWTSQPAVPVGGTQQLDMTISTSATGGTPISWGLTIDSVQSP